MTDVFANVKGKESVLYLHPPKPPINLRMYAGAARASPYWQLPVGVLGMMNLLRHHGYRVTGLNVPLEIAIDGRFDLHTWLGGHEDVGLIAIDLHWYEHAFGALDVARACKQVASEAPVVLGGLTASCYWREILSEFAEADFVVRGDGELSLLQLANYLLRGEGGRLEDIPNICYRADGTVRSNSLDYCASSEDLDSLDFVDTSFLVHARQYHQIQFAGGTEFRVAGSDAPQGHWLCTGRGCRYDCSFCGGGRRSHHLLTGRKGVVPRSPGKIVRDLSRLEERGIKQASLSLDPSILGIGYWSELLSKTRDNGIRIGLNNECFQLPSDEFLQEYVRACDTSHSQLVFSPLSGSESVRRRNGKHFTNDQLLAALSLLRPARIPIAVFFSLNLPGESERAFRDTLVLANRICDMYPPELLRMSNMVHTLDPCSPMSIRPAHYGIQVEFRTFLDYYNYCENTPVLKPELPLVAYRGYHTTAEPARRLDKLAQEWDALCAKQSARCLPVPRTW